MQLRVPFSEESEIVVGLVLVSKRDSSWIFYLDGLNGGFLSSGSIGIEILPHF